MRLRRYGYRIRPSDKSLVAGTIAGLFFISAFFVFCVLNIGTVSALCGNTLKLSEITFSTYHMITLIISVILSFLILYLLYRYRYDDYKQLVHRQMLARMILENGWHISEATEKNSFDSFVYGKEKITYFPKIYYRLENGVVYVRVQITMGKSQDMLLNLEKRLESGLFCELTDKVLKNGYIEYSFLYDVISNRIPIEEVKAENGKLHLMKNLDWEYDSLPHALICGGTGGGKTYFILTIIECLLRTNAHLYILDPKNADLADLKEVMDDVYYRKEEMIGCIDRFYEAMMERSESMKQMDNYVTGKNYAYMGLEPHFLIFDEYVAFMSTLSNKESTAVLNQLMRIVMLGRQVGYFIILACQRPDAKYFSDGIRDQFNFRVALGRNSELGYGMMFGSECQKQFFQKNIRGRGYCDTGKGVISEFYTPLVGKEHDFLKTIGRLAHERLREDSTDEV